MHDLALEQERAAEELGGAGDVARRHEAADVARGDGLAADLDERHHARLELGVRGAGSPASPLAPLPKRKFSPTDTLLGAELADQHLLDELLGVLGGELAVERDHDQLLDAEPGDQVALDRERR